jgi:mRNA interferase YafQ
MTEISFTAAFRKALKRKFRKNPNLEKRFWERVDIFRNNPHDPRLRTHKLSGAMKDWWSFSVDYGLRVIFSFVGPDRALFLDIGTHEEVY